MELQEKQDKGLCYNCDQKYNVNHRCYSKFILPIVYEEDIKPYTASIESQFVVEEVVGGIFNLNALVG